MIDAYTLKKLQQITGSELAHNSQIVNLWMQLKARDEKARDSLSRTQAVPDSFHPYLINISTLLRIFGLKEKDYVAKKENLDKLARFAGYPNYRAIMMEAQRSLFKYEDNPYSGVMDDSTLYSVCLQRGTRIDFKYREGREISMVYNGDNLFKITRSVISQMSVGELYRIMAIMDGKPLPTNEATINTPYTCGKCGGIYDILVNGQPLRAFMEEFMVER